MALVKHTFHYSKALCLLVLATALHTSLHAQKKPKPVPPVSYNAGRLAYTTDSLGNRIPDFSFCGYKASEQAIPMVPAVITVPVKTGDATASIQAAIDYVAGQPLNAAGFRGAVLLQKGVYEVYGQLHIKTSGVVLRGSGTGKEGTTLTGAGFDRQALVRVHGVQDKALAAETRITTPYVPVNASRFTVADATGYKVGDQVIVRRPSTAAWINELGTDHFGGGITSLGWKPGERDLYFDRTITAVDGNDISIDAPLTTALDTSYGGGYIASYQWNGRINNIGIENLQLASAYDKSNPKDEDHRWMAITIENAQDVWIRQAGFQHFAGSAVYVLETARRITVEDCISTQPVSEIGGQRRYTFYTNGQQTLFQRCYAEEGYHDFATGYCTPGPNAFVQCESHLPYNFSGAIDSWSSGILFDIVYVDGNAIRFGNRGQDGQGAGWAAANSLLWNCSAARIDCYQPPTAQNWSFGSWAQFAGDGVWFSSNDAVQPRSFYYAQLNERLKRNTDNQSNLLRISTEASSSPSVEVAQQLTKEAGRPQMQLKEWIGLAATRTPIDSDAKGVKRFESMAAVKNAALAKAPALQLRNGLLLRGTQYVIGLRQEVPWWTGGIHGSDLKKANYAITRFVPGQTGKGLTDDLDEMTDSLKAKGIIGLEQHYALWYERRRDDHERIRRMDGEVWPPFYELPFARTGKETAWDGLSKYDLTKYNKWYWGRIKQYADLADQKGLILVHQNYFQHNIIEAGAHYADFPWRTANNINATGFPEPPPYAGDKRIFMAEQFYDITNPTRRELHRKYIRQCLDNFKDNNGVIQLIGEEFTGPLHFVKFWLDVIKQWEKETGKHPLIGLSATKDVQDSILANLAYASVVDIIDIRYWHYQADGNVYAPKGGLNLAPRQHARLLKPKKTSFEQVYRAVKEYKAAYPDKAVVYSGDSFDQFAWAVVMAGGSLPALPATTDKQFTEAIAGMKPLSNTSTGLYVLSNGTAWVVYGNGNTSLDIKAVAAKQYTVKFINTWSGMVNKEEKMDGLKLKTLTVQQGQVLWIY
jgi:hypothetical protein